MPATKPVTVAVGNRRLLKLAKFLRKLPKRDFNFAEWVSDFKKNGHVCGTTCCAVGWMPKVDPKNWKWKGDSFYVEPKLRKSRLKWTIQQAGKYFGLSSDDVDLLFIPNWSLEARLPETASAKQVAAHIEKFVRGRK